MSDGSKIEWTEATWNPVTGCTKVSPGCDNCYAETLHERFHGKGSFAVVHRSEDKLYAPLKWRRPRRVFVNSMSDLFHEQVPLSFIQRVFSVMARTPQHTYQLLTKRHGRMRSVLSSTDFAWSVFDLLSPGERMTTGPVVGFPNVWLGVSVENQHWANIRVPSLVATGPGRWKRWLSCEPLLGPLDLTPWLSELDWVVIGGESGPRSRPIELAWARSLRDQCVAAGVPFFFKQWGNWVAPSQMTEETFGDFDSVYGCDVYDEDQPRRFDKKRAGRLLDGREWNEYPSTAAGGAEGDQSNGGSNA